MSETPDLRQQFLDAAKEAKTANDHLKQAKATLIESFGFKVGDIVKPRKGKLTDKKCIITTVSFTPTGKPKITLSVFGSKSWKSDDQENANHLEFDRAE